MDKTNTTFANVKIKLLNENATLPTRGSEQAAGFDLYACLEEAVKIPPHQTKMIGTGIATAIQDGYFGAIYARSGLATKQGLRPANCVGVIDSDYRGEIKVALHNDTEEFHTVRHKDRIAQFVIQKYEPIIWDVVDELPDTERGDGGFGHTGR